jgi:hypothetical protein
LEDFRYIRAVSYPKSIVYIPLSVELPYLITSLANSFSSLDSSR